MTLLKNLIQEQIEAAKLGLDYPDAFQILKQIVDECREIKEDIQGQSSSEKIQEEIGDLLHASIYLCVFSKFDVEETLEKAHVKFKNRMSSLKKLLATKKNSPSSKYNLNYLLQLWDEVKSEESK